MSNFYQWVRRLSERWIMVAAALVAATFFFGIIGHLWGDPNESFLTAVYHAVQLFDLGGPTDPKFDNCLSTLLGCLDLSSGHSRS